MTGRGPGALPGRILLALLVVASLAPVANWIPSERSVPWYPEAVRQWALGLVVLIGGGVVLAAASRRVTGLWRSGAVAEGLARFDPADSRALLLVVALVGVVYLLVARFVFDGRPLLIDEAVQLFQARTYASGRLWLPVDPDPAFRSTLNLVEQGGRWFGHFPPGWPVLLALGDLVHLGWAVGPIVGAATVGMWGLVLVRAESRPSVRAGALLLFGLAPFPMFLASSHMNHGPVLFWLLAALAGWLALRERPGAGRAVATGFALGMAGITRPADAVAFAIPAAVWAALWARDTGRIRDLGAIVAGAVLPVAFLLVVNQATTGSIWQSGYELLWGSNVGLGFHAAPYGPPHTPVRGLELVSLYLLRLNRFLFEAPVPGLVAGGLALLLAPRLGAVDRFLLAAAGTLLLVYFAYWHDGFFLGPRFVYPLVPVVALWTARLPGLVRDRWGDGLAYRTTGFAMAGAVAGAVAIGIPARLGANSAIQMAMRVDPDREAEAAGVRDAVVFVRESWGAQLLARMWSLGVSKPAAERFYRNIDSCVLDRALLAIERGERPGPAAAQLEPLQADSARLVRSPFSPDTSERVLNGAKYERRCVDRINEDRAGFTILAPWLLSRRTDILFVRDLAERNASLLARYPGRQAFRVSQPPDSVGFRWERIER
ncbi:MAG: hypothetical protein JNJ80_24135 [Gemmatimonadetes bacterium]|nr:hypothetical protein [Gemmatimonadota bacterium]